MDLPPPFDTDTAQLPSDRRRSSGDLDVAGLLECRLAEFNDRDPQVLRFQDEDAGPGPIVRAEELR